MQDEENGWCIAEYLITKDVSVYNKVEDAWIKIDPGDWVVKAPDGFVPGLVVQAVYG